MTSLATIIGFGVIGFVIVVLVVILFVLLKLARIKKKARAERGGNLNGKQEERRSPGKPGGGGNDGRQTSEIRKSFRPTSERELIDDRRLLPERNVKSITLHSVTTE